MKKRDDRDELREHVELDDEAGGFQVRETTTRGLSPDDAALADALIEFAASVKPRELAIMLVLRDQNYKVRETARLFGISHTAVRRVIAKVLRVRARQRKGGRD